MSLPHWSYAAMLAFCLAGGTLPLVVVFGLALFRQPGRLALAILAAAVPFVLWDLYATSAGHWRFDPARRSRGGWSGSHWRRSPSSW